ncbi:MAG: hypothetical protein ACOCUO_02965 [archaeon]
MTNGTLPFTTTDYDKFKHPVFPTIRRRDKYGDVGDVNEVRVDGHFIGTVEIVAKETVTIDELNEQLFQYDTDTATTDTAREYINGFYQRPIGDSEPLTMYWNRWVNKKDKPLTEWSV